MDDYDYQAGEDFSTGGKWLKAPGRYHFIVESIERPVLDRNQSVITNAEFRIALKVLAGTTPGQEDKLLEETFYTPMPSHSDQGAFARKKIDRLFLATGLLGADQGGQKVKLDLPSIRGRQLVATIEENQGSNGKVYAGIAFADLFHVDDLEVQAVPKKEEALKLIPSQFRRIGQQQAEAPKPPQGDVDMGAI